MDEWYPGRITSSEREAAGLQSIRVDVSGTPLVGSHSLPGQYVRVRLDAGEGTFAIASGPETDGATFELLVKSGSDVADLLAVAPIGTRVELTAPEGPGFPLSEAYGKRVLLFATGSAISAIRSLIQAIRHERRKFRSVTLYFGARACLTLCDVLAITPLRSSLRGPRLRRPPRPLPRAPASRRPLGSPP